METIDRLVISIGCGLSLFAFFERKGLAASILAVVLSWIFTSFALGVGGVFLTLYLVLNIVGKTKSKQKDEVEQDVIDVEFTVNGENQWKKSERQAGTLYDL